MNERQANAEMMSAATKREAVQADLRHLHRRAQSSPDWSQGRGPNQPPTRARDVRALRWVLVGLAVFWVCVVAAIVRGCAS